MKRFLMMIALACVLSSSALAGDIPCGAPAPVPQGSTQTTSATLPGEIPTSGYAIQISDAALSGLLSVFGLLVG
jgi:opacity protein-like surface antigen